MELTGTVAVVTGASSGIGAATSRRLAAAGASVALVARRSSELRGVCEQITASGGRARAVVADLTDADAADRVVDEVVSALGRLDVLVNNAGVALVGPVAGASSDDRADWSRMVDLNLRAVIDLAGAALGHLIDAAEGPRGVADIVNVASIAGRRPQAGSAVYAATKSAVQAFSESLRQEVAVRQVRVGVITTGAVRTEAAVAAMARVGRSGSEYLGVDELASAIEFMVSRPRGMAANEIVLRPTRQVS